MYSLLTIPPSFVMFIGALIIFFVADRRVCAGVSLLIPVLTLAVVWRIPVGEELLVVEVAGFALKLIYAHPYTHIFATIFVIAAFAGALFGLLQSKRSEVAAAMLYAGGAIGVVFSGDLVSLFVYWELMAVGSTMVLFAVGGKDVIRVGMRYALIHFMGGVILMTGIIAYVGVSGNADIVNMDASMSVLFPDGALSKQGVMLWLILVGVLINAAAPPFSAWLADAYPRSSEFGAVFLSAFTTKTAVFVLLTLFAGAEILIYVGLFMVFYGIVYAMLENDMRKILSYSIVNQVGFMVTGIGIGTQMALNGAATHAFAHIIYKALLFMSAGSVLYMTGKSKCTQLGGLYKTMRVTTLCGIVGALSISAFPFTSGFVSKSMISGAAMGQELQVVWLLLLAASAGVFLHAGIKFPWFVFFQKDSGLRPKDPPWNMQLAMVLFSVVCFALAVPGWTEKTLYSLLPVMPDYQSYTVEHVVTQTQLLLFSGLAFFMFLPMLKRTETVSLDFDWLYRKLGYYILCVFYSLLRLPARVVRIVCWQNMKKLKRVIYIIHHPEGILARNWSLGTTCMFTVTLLGVYLIVYYINI